MYISLTSPISTPGIFLGVNVWEMNDALSKVTFSLFNM